MEVNLEQYKMKLEGLIEKQGSISDEDDKELSSRNVKRAKWTKHVPDALLGVELTPNKACTQLRDALRPGAVRGAAGVNKYASIARFQPSLNGTSRFAREALTALT